MTACATPPSARERTRGRHRRPSSLESSALSLMVSSATTALLGLVYWAVAARNFPAEEVGRASATLTSAIMLAGLAQLSLGSMYERFLGLARVRTVALIAQGQAAGAAAATLLGGAFVLLGPREKLFHTGWEAAAFPLLVVVLAVFSLQDAILVGLRAAPLVAAKNIGHAVAKLGLVAALAYTATGTTIVWAWLLPAAVAAVAVNGWIAARIHPRRARTGPAQLPPRRELLQFFGASYTMTVMQTVVPLALPLIVVYRFGTEENAYFATAWTLASAAVLLIAVVAGPFVAEAGAQRDPAELARLTRRFVRLLALISVAGGAALFLTAPWLLAIFGPAYQREGTDLARLMALALPLVAVNTLYLAFARVFRRLTVAVAVQPVTIAVMLGGSVVLSDRFGLAGVGAAYLCGEAAAAALVSVSLARLYRRAVAGGPHEG